MLTVIKELKTLVSSSGSHNAKKLWLLVTFVIFATVVDLVGLGSVIPFFLSLSDPNIIKTNEILILVSGYFNFENDSQFIIYIGFFSVTLLLISALLRAYSSFLQIKTGLFIEADLATRYFELFLKSRFDVFSSYETNDVIKEINSECGEVIRSSLLPSIFIVSNLVTTFSIFILLLLLDLQSTLFITLSFAFVFFCLTKLTRPRLLNYGAGRYKANEFKYKNITESLNSWTSVVSSGLEKHFVDRYRESAGQHAYFHSSAQLIGQLPRFAIEFLVFGMFIGVAIFVLQIKGDHDLLLAKISMFALAGYRIMPAMNQVYLNLSMMRFGSQPLLNINNNISRLSEAQRDALLCKIDEASDELLKLENICYCHQGADEPILENLNFYLGKSESVAIFGRSGSGKSTLAELLLGFRKPDSGSIELMGTKVCSPISSGLVGYVPQNVSVFNDTISFNVSLKHDLVQEEIERVKQVLDLVDLLMFVEHDFIGGVFGNVGEDGSNLSGGQRQRLVIARVLYSDPKILILDEATSAQDSMTQELIVNNIKKFRFDVSTILITHRNDAARYCSRSYQLRGKQLHQI